jgi:hypothetical protein
VTPEQLRRAALASLGPHADERARDALVRATIVIARSVARWVASAGEVEAHRVTLVVDAATLGRVRAAPAIADLLCTAVAAAIAGQPGETLHELELRWSPAARPAAAPYRDAPPASPEITLRDALVAYLDASDNAPLARLVDDAEVGPPTTVPIVVRVRVPGPAYDKLRSLPGAVDGLTRALRDLLGYDRAKVRLRAR